MVQCRCQVLNHLTGAMAADYARIHLDPLGPGATGWLFACPDTGVRWTDETPAGTTGVTTLRRRER